MKKFTVVLCALVLCLSAAAFAGTTDIYAAIPLNFDKSNGTEVQGTAIGAGIMSSTLRRDGIFGITMALTGYYPMDISMKTDGVSYTATTSDMYSVPFGLDAMLGITLNPFKIGIFSFPITVGAHAKTDFYKIGQQFDLGAAGNVGLKISLGGFGVFVRTQISYDFYRFTLLDTGKTSSDSISVWGVQPQIGISFAGK